jgi:DNA repair protein RadC
MTDISMPHDAICAAAVRHRGDRSEGALRAVFLDRRRSVFLTIGFDEGTRHVDELFLRHVVAIVTDLRVSAVAFVVLRPGGRPARVDRRLWQELSERLADTTTALVDVIVVGDKQRWSASTGRTDPFVAAA